MNLKKWDLAHCPTKDRDRWRLKLSIDEAGLSALAAQLPVQLGQPFMLEDDEYSIAFYMYDVPESDIETLRFVLKAQTAPAAAPAAHAVQFHHLELIPHYTFQEFVIGPNNRFTAAAAQAVADNPGKIYNPFFIYGGVGLGKTHLMHAVGHYIRAKNSALHVAYVTTEKFISDVIDAIRHGVVQEMRDYYRQVDILLVDDIQFLVNSESTQEEFFHTFNVLHQSGKQIIITSDRPPKHLTTLEDRLRSRFEWGLIADIKSPNLETRVAILKKKGESEKLSLDENMLLYIASKLKSNIRELEGFLKRINAYASLTQQPVTIDLVKSIMADLLPADEAEEPASRPAYTASPLAQPPITIPAVDPFWERPPVVDILPEAPSIPSSEEVARRYPSPAPAAEQEQPPVQRSVEQPRPPAPPVVPAPRTAPPTPPPMASSDPVEATLKPVEVAFFFPVGKTAELAAVKERFAEVIKKHKLKFSLTGLLETEYVFDSGLDYFSFSRMCKEKNITIAVVLGPETKTGGESEDFANTISAAMDEGGISLQLIPWQELNKDYRYLNLALDITLIKSKL